ncbi:hypothetical protein CL632_00315 [bacterium]|jgi:hypothetical protein|nr:hypothetical protein [bacterium]MDP6571786.1 hypothetical protein [Patescibacteria group bacterium]MDP6756499.1 hypothetical protein [Patescibacteria group bacterium]|tara:strand:+ start:3785 stop:4102 length:318 start_codon:yes stop_codon:yes gene_type:complete
MALIHKKISKAKQLKLGIALLLVIGTTLGVAYFGLLRKPSAPLKTGLIGSTQRAQIGSRLPAKNGFEIIVDLKDSSMFKQLKSFGIWPLPLEPKGRTQPFIERQE